MCRATPCRIFRLFLCRMPSHAALSLGARRKSSRLAGALVIFIYKKACQAQLIQAQERYEGNNGPCLGAARNEALQNCFNQYHLIVVVVGAQQKTSKKTCFILKFFCVDDIIIIRCVHSVLCFHFCCVLLLLLLIIIYLFANSLLCDLQQRVSLLNNLVARTSLGSRIARRANQRLFIPKSTNGIICIMHTIYKAHVKSFICNTIMILFIAVQLRILRLKLDHMCTK